MSIALPESYDICRATAESTPTSTSTESTPTSTTTTSTPTSTTTEFYDYYDDYDYDYY